MLMIRRALDIDTKRMLEMSLDYSPDPYSNVNQFYYGLKDRVSSQNDDLPQFLTYVLFEKRGSSIWTQLGHISHQLFYFPKNIAIVEDLALDLDALNKVGNEREAASLLVRCSEDSTIRRFHAETKGTLKKFIKEINENSVEKNIFVQSGYTPLGGLNHYGYRDYHKVVEDVCVNTINGLTIQGTQTKIGRKA
jgi:hypothetical protein